MTLRLVALVDAYLTDVNEQTGQELVFPATSYRFTLDAEFWTLDVDGGREM